MAGIWDDTKGIISNIYDALHKPGSSIPGESQESRGFLDTMTRGGIFNPVTENNPSLFRPSATAYQGESTGAKLKYKAKNYIENKTKEYFPPTPVDDFGASTGPVTPFTPTNKDENNFFGQVGQFFKTAKDTWQDKGGFETLMSDPQFILGMSIMQSASQGKSLSASGLTNLVESGVISKTFKDSLEKRVGVKAPMGDAQHAEVEAALKSQRIYAPGFFTKLFSLDKDKQAEWRASSTLIYDEAHKAANERSKKSKVFERILESDYATAANKLIDSGKIKPESNGFWGFGQKTFGASGVKIKDTRQLGGPVTKNTSYLVGEVGPEVFIPKVSGKIISFDDSKIINLLLESNPQLKALTPARSEKILRNRFPDYFE